MVEFHYNRFMERHDIQLPYQLGDIKDMVTVAHVEDDKGIEKIHFVQELTIEMVRSIINSWEEFRAQKDRNPLDDLPDESQLVCNTDGRAAHFESYPDGENNV